MTKQYESVDELLRVKRQGLYELVLADLARKNINLFISPLILVTPTNPETVYLRTVGDRVDCSPLLKLAADSHPVEYSEYLSFVRKYENRAA